MLTYTGSRNLFGQLTNNTSTNNLSYGDVLINEGIRQMLGDLPWPFLQTTSTASTVASTQSYVLPGNIARLVSVYIQVGTYKYVPTEVVSFDDWNRLNNPTGVLSDNVSYYFIQDSTIQFWPTPASSSNTITYEYLQAVKDISVADYTTGTITTATTGSASIVGSGTSWNAGMIGKYLRITSDNAANKGDGLWYKILAVPSATTMTLNAVYVGASITAGTAAYTIGDCPVIPEKYQLGPVYYAASQYWRKENQPGMADRFEAQFNEVLTRMKREEGTKGSSVVIDDNIDTLVINPNLNKSAT